MESKLTCSIRSSESIYQLKQNQQRGVINQKQLQFIQNNNMIKDDNYIMNSDNYKLRSSIRRVPNEAQQQFKTIVEDMIKSHQKQQISFNEFMGLFGKYNIKFFSPEQFKKMSRLFNNTFHVLPTHTPFEYLQLHSKQITSTNPYYLVRILHKKIDIYINDNSKAKVTHTVDKCMKNFIFLMKQRYGNEINWFKVLGGMTVAVSIESEVFKANLYEILKNSSHHKCIQQLMTLFADPKEKRVTWNKFMEIVKKSIRKYSQSLTQKNRSSTSKHRRMFLEKEKDQSESFFFIKSNFNKSNNPSINSLAKPSKLSISSYGGSGWAEDRSYFRSRCKTEGADSIELDTHQNPLISRMKMSMPMEELKGFSCYPIKKSEISLKADQKKTSRNYFLWKYLKDKMEAS